jgi:hypothetical protein
MQKPDGCIFMLQVEIMTGFMPIDGKFVFFLNSLGKAIS